MERFCVFLIVFVFAVATIFAFYRPYRIPTASMEPTLKVGDRYILNCLSLRLFAGIRRGDIVSFAIPDKNRVLVERCLLKRVVGLPKEKVEVDFWGNVRINGLALNEPYIKIKRPREAVLHEPWHQTFVLGDDEYFMMGDNRMISVDSREFGPVKKNMIYGKFGFFLWPPEKMFRHPQ